MIRVPLKVGLILLRAEDGVFGGFGDAELHDALGLDLDRFAGGRITTDTGFAIDEHEFAEARNRESIFGVFVSQVRNVFEDLDGLFFGDAVLFCKCGSDL